jgi:hypothetical protein
VRSLANANGRSDVASAVLLEPVHHRHEYIEDDQAAGRPGQRYEGLGAHPRPLSRRIPRSAARAPASPAHRDHRPPRASGLPPTGKAVAAARTPGFMTIRKSGLAERLLEVSAGRAQFKSSFTKPPQARCHDSKRSTDTRQAGWPTLIRSPPPGRCSGWSGTARPTETRSAWPWATA